MFWRDVSGLLEGGGSRGDSREAALRCANMPMAVARFSAIRDFWAGVRGGGLGWWGGFGAFVEVWLLFWEEVLRLVAGVVVVDAIRDVWAGG